MSKLFLILGTC